MRAGWASEDITPGPESDLIGYGFRQEQLPPGNAGVAAPLLARALAVAGDDGPGLIISLDLCILSPSQARQLRQDLATACAVPGERIMVACTHTHSGPWLPEPEQDQRLGAILEAQAQTDDGEVYRTRLQQAVLSAARRALGLMVPVRMRHRAVPCGVGYCRRVMHKGVMHHCWNPAEQDHLQPQTGADPQLDVLVIEQDGGRRRCLLWNLGVHPVVLGKTSRLVSPDYPGAANTLLETWDGDDFAMFLLGAAGDIHPWLATQDDPQAVHTVARAAAAHVSLVAASAGRRQVPGTFAWAATTCTIAGAELDLMAWRWGELVLLAAPVELFADLAVQLRERCAGPLMIITNANGWTGYWAPEAAYDHPRYEIEAGAQWGRSRGDGERLVEALVALVDQL